MGRFYFQGDITVIASKIASDIFPFPVEPQIDLYGHSGDK